MSNSRLDECVELVKESDLKRSVIVLMEIISGLQDSVEILENKVETLEDGMKRSFNK